MTSEPGDLILVRYGELALKGGNRDFFEQTLVANIKRATAPLAKVRVRRERGRLTAHLADHPERLHAVVRRMQEVPGISSLSVCLGVEPDPDAISAVVNAELERRLEFERGPVTFRIKARRADKRFALTSAELNQHVAERLPQAVWDKVVVRMKGAELEVGIEVRAQRAYVYLERLPGAGGLPVGTLGRVACLLSGGIDSPVAAWYAMRRGCRVHFVSFLSPPYIGDGTRTKILELVKRVGRFQPRSEVFFVPFTKIQETIRDTAPPAYRTVLYRRMMQRIGSRIAYRNKARALVTGESIGQVASQTLENIGCIAEAAQMPVVRPLIGFDKTETIDVARRIGTFDISNLPEPDCCTVFMPPAPVIRGRIEECHAAEALFDVDELVREALAGTEVLRVENDTVERRGRA